MQPDFFAKRSACQVRRVGAKLARMEVQITLEEMFNRFEGFSIPEGYQIEYHDLPLFRGLKKLEIDTVKR